MPSAFNPTPEEVREEDGRIRRKPDRPVRPLHPWGAPRIARTGSFDLFDIGRGIYHAVFPDHHTMGMTLVRLQEHYESPEFRGKIFTLEEFKDWYMKEKCRDSFTYCEDWAGFNIPSSVIRPFLDGRFSGISALEDILIQELYMLPHPFYLIATSDPADGRNLRHEMSHALWHLDPDYRNKARRHLACLPEAVRADVDWRLERAGYHQAVHDDELAAYMACEQLYVPTFPLCMDGLEDLNRSMKRLLDRRLEELTGGRSQLPE